MKISTAHSLFRFYSEKELRKFYEEFCKESGPNVKEYIWISPGGEIVFQGAKLNINFYVHDLNSIFKSIDMVRNAGGIDPCKEAIKTCGRWVHHRFIEAVADYEECKGLNEELRLAQ